MDRLAERLADWFGLTLIASLEAIFLSMFILRAENVQAEQFDKNVKRDLKTTRAILRKLNRRNK